MARGKKRVLIVDDQTSIRHTMSGIVEDFGYQVDGAEDGYHAIDLVKNDTFELIFLDIKMPGINGVQTFREIKKLRPESLVVLMTGYEVEELIDDGMNEGALAVMGKPIEPESVVRLLQSTSNRPRSGLPESVDRFVKQCQVLLNDVALSPITRIVLRIADAELHALRLVTAAGPSADNTPVLASISSMGGSAYVQSEPVAVNDYPSHIHHALSEADQGIKSSLAIPFKSSTGQVLGSVVVSSSELDYFTTEKVNGFAVVVEGIETLLASSKVEESEIVRYLNGLGLSAEHILV